ncbi:hypothetical protein ABRP83_16300 [Pectobacterium brasiliense]|uniref:hypothetical protein n=1 Tax=Pectobacterium brasiliense TaxID=180957 RepID=UPI0032EAF7F1
MKDNLKYFWSGIISYPYKQKIISNCKSYTRTFITHPRWSIFVIISTIPICLYFWRFNSHLSYDPQIWSAFGTFIGGIYGPIFTLASVFVLVATLISINNFNVKTFKENQKANSLSQIIKLIEIMNLALDKKNKFLSNNRSYAFDWLFDAIIERCKYEHPSNEQELWDIATFRFEDTDIYTFHDEIAIFNEILLRINNADDEELKGSAIAAFRAIIRNDERFWLECFTKRFHNEKSLIIKLWPTPFCIMPAKLLSLIEQPEDSIT